MSCGRPTMYEQVNEKRSFSLLAVRLGDSMSKSDKLCSIIRYLFRTRLQLIPLLLGRCYRRLCQNQLNLALRRIDSGTRSSWGQSSRMVRFKVLGLPFLDVRNALVDVFIPHIEMAISKGAAVSLMGTNKGFLSVKWFLTNGHTWKRKADTELLPCHCKIMKKLLGIKDNAGHCCVRLKDTLFGQTNPEYCSMDTIILPSRATFMDSLVDAVNHIYDTLPGIDNEKLYQSLLPMKIKIGN